MRVRVGVKAAPLSRAHHARPHQNYVVDFPRHIQFDSHIRKSLINVGDNIAHGMDQLAFGAELSQELRPLSLHAVPNQTSKSRSAKYRKQAALILFLLNLFYVSKV